MDQQEEWMKRDILGQLELSIIQTDMAIMRTSDPDERRRLSDWIKTLKAKRNSVADKCANMSLAIGNLIQNPPQTAPTSQTTFAPPTPLPSILPPPPPTPATSNTKFFTSPDQSPPKQPAPPHMDIPTPQEKKGPVKKKQRSSATSRKSSEGERRLTRCATRMNLQVTSQSTLEHGDVDDVMKDAFGMVKTVSTSTTDIHVFVNLETSPGPIE